MHPAYVNNIVMPSDSRSTPRLAFLYHRYLVCSEIRVLNLSVTKQVISKEVLSTELITIIEIYSH